MTDPATPRPTADTPKPLTDRPVSPPSELTDVVERILIRLPWEERAALRAEWHAALDAARAVPEPSGLELAAQEVSGAFAVPPPISYRQASALAVLRDQLNRSEMARRAALSADE